MAGRKLISASLGFSKYLCLMKKRLKEDTGRSFSEREITAFLAAQTPVIKIETNGKKRRVGSIFDF